jgi:hypothetical protein
VPKNAPTLFWYDPDADGWQSLPLLPDYFANEMAKAAIASLGQQGRNVPINPAYPETIRELNSLNDFWLTLPAEDTPDQLGQFGAGAISLLAGRFLDSSRLNLSAMPVLTDTGHDEEGVDVAIVAASTVGVAKARASSLRNVLGPFYQGRLITGDFDTEEEIQAGTLFFVHATRLGVLARERVAEDVWCTSLAARVNPVTGLPAILALATAPDGPDSQPSSALTLYQKQADGTWKSEVVWQDQPPIVDADFVFASDARPHVVAAKAGGQPGKGRLAYLTRNNAWIVAPISWAIDTLPLDLGAWPRIVLDDRERPVVGFSLYVPDAIFRIVAVLDGGAWRAAKVAVTNLSDLRGVLGAANDPDVDSIIQQVDFDYGLTFAHWAPALAQGRMGKVWFAHGHGTPRLVEIDTETLGLNDVRLDVDRTTGFFPALSVHADTPAMVYKDFFGSGFQQIDLHFLAAGQGLTYPGDPKLPEFAELIWRRAEQSVSLATFGAHVPLNCTPAADGTPSAIAEALVLLAVAAAAGNQDVAAAISGSFLASALFTGTLNLRLDVSNKTTTFTILNSDHPEEDIQSIEVTLKSPPPPQPPPPPHVVATGRTAPCGSLDALGILFNQFGLDPASLVGNVSSSGLETATLSGMRLGMAPDPDTLTGQQGGIRFTLTIPTIAATGSQAGVGWNAHSTEPSSFSFVLAPYVADLGDGKNLQWYTREVQAHVGHVDVNVNLVLSWAGVLVTVLTGGGLLPRCCWVRRA